MSQNIECTLEELLERINRGEIPRAATFHGTIDYPAPNVPQDKDKSDKSVKPTLKDILGYEPERAASAEEWEADRAEFDLIHEFRARRKLAGNRAGFVTCDVPVCKNL